MGKKQFIVVSNVHMGKTPYTLVSGTPIATAKWNTLDKGIVFEADEADVTKLLAAGAIKPYKGSPTAKEPEPVEAVNEPAAKRGK
jgi:hypothetical protein